MSMTGMPSTDLVPRLPSQDAAVEVFVLGYTYYHLKGKS